MLTADRIRVLLDYDPGLGLFIWKTQVNRFVHVGGVAGVICPGTGYRKIRIDGSRYLAHRLAWLYVHGKWPEADIDHINGQRSANRISNLREATRSQNNANSRRSRANTSGVKGVHWCREKGRWRAYIRVNRTRKFLGSFDVLDEARAAYEQAAHEHFGEFARVA